MEQHSSSNSHFAALSAGTAIPPHSVESRAKTEERPLQPQRVLDVPRANTRVSQACEKCRIRKVKCSGGNPCERCFLRAFQCEYRKSNKRSRGPAVKDLCSEVPRLGRPEVSSQQTSGGSWPRTHSLVEKHSIVSQPSVTPTENGLKPLYDRQLTRPTRYSVGSSRPCTVHYTDTRHSQLSMTSKHSPLPLSFSTALDSGSASLPSPPAVAFRAPCHPSVKFPTFQQWNGNYHPGSPAHSPSSEGFPASSVPQHDARLSWTHETSCIPRVLAPSSEKELEEDSQYYINSNERVPPFQTFTRALDKGLEDQSHFGVDVWVRNHPQPKKGCPSYDTGLGTVENFDSQGRYVPPHDFCDGLRHEWCTGHSPNTTTATNQHT